MSKQKVIEKIVQYFKSDQWSELLRILRQEETEIYHVHMYTKSSVDAYGLSRLFDKYFTQIGMPLDRKTEVHTGGERHTCSLHSVHPSLPGRKNYVPHFDFNWLYDKDVILEAADPTVFGEEGQNILSWDKKYMDEFHSRFPFLTVGPAEEKQIRHWFGSAQWKKLLELVESGKNTHVHANVEMNFHPWILKEMVLRELAKVGWTVENIVPCVYHYDGKSEYHGKIVFLNDHPDFVWDIGWEFNPEVVLRPALRNYWGMPPADGDPCFDVWTKDLLKSVLDEDSYITLEDDQIDQILAQIQAEPI